VSYLDFVSFRDKGPVLQHRLANNIPAASGASSFAILGRAVQPPRLAITNTK
jgi:hypothetical protein